MLLKRREKEREREGRKDSRKRKREEEGEEEKEMPELERRMVKEKGFQSEPDNWCSMRKTVKRRGERRCGTRPDLPEEEEGPLGWKGAAARYGTVKVTGEEKTQERRDRQERAFEEAMAAARKKKRERTRQFAERKRKERGREKQPSGAQKRKWKKEREQAEKEKKEKSEKIDVHGEILS